MERHARTVMGRCSLDINVSVTCNSDGELTLFTDCNSNSMEVTLSVFMAEKVIEVLQEYLRNKGAK